MDDDPRSEVLAIIPSIKVMYGRVMGSLRERSLGVWQARVYKGLDPVSGARRYVARTIHAKTESAAQRELRKFERRVATGRASRGTTAVTLGEQLDDWYANKKPRLAPGTRLGYESAMRLCERLRPIPLGKVSARDLDALYATVLVPLEESETVHVPDFDLAQVLPAVVPTARPEP